MLMMRTLCSLQGRAGGWRTVTGRLRGCWWWGSREGGLQSEPLFLLWQLPCWGIEVGTIVTSVSLCFFPVLG